MSRRRREPSATFWRTSIGAMAGSVLLLFGVLAFNRPPAIDPLTNCRMDQKDPAHTILLIDQSDPFNPNDFGWVREFMDVEARLLPKYGRLTLMAPRADRPFDPRHVFEACSTGSEADANPILHNPQMVADEWRTRFLEPLQGQMDALLQNDRQPASPLSEAIYTIADRANFQPKTSQRRLVIVSDMMQHSKDFSFYKWGADYEAFLKSRLGTQTPKMDGISVTARIVPRTEYDLPLETLRTFWGTYFRDAGARFETVNS